MKNLRRLISVVSMASLALFVMASTAFAAPPTPAEVVGDGAESIVTQLTNILVALLPIVAPLAAIVIGWRLARRFVKV